MANVSHLRGKVVAIPSSLYAEPLRAAIAKSFPEFHFTSNTPAQLALHFRERNSDIALLSSLDYAKESSVYRIIPNIGISSYDGLGTVSLYFKKGLKKILTLAADPNYTSEIVLAHILLAEQYETQPKLIPHIGDVDSMLSVADAALIVRNEVVSEKDVLPCLDIVALWNDVYELPFVHGVLTCYEGALSEKEFQSFSHLGSALQESVLHNAETRDEMLYADELFREVERNNYLAKFSYQLGVREMDSLREYFRLAFYYGILKDIPDIRMYAPEQLMFSAN